MNDVNQKYICEEIEGMCDGAGEGEFRYYPDYSGRCMYGKNCVGIVGRTETEIMVELMQLIPNMLNESEDGMEDLYNDFIHVMKSARSDNMGTRMIVYFPSLQDDRLEEFDESEEEEEDENENENENEGMGVDHSQFGTVDKVVEESMSID